MYAISKICLLLLTVIQLFFITACSGIPPCQKLEKNGMSYGWSEGNFMGDWDDYYQCALSYIEGEFYPEALEYLDKAINRRDKDRRMARSYGLHFVENYFPHREKGWVYYVTDKYEEALFELNTSIQHEPSDKAYKIRDKVLIQMMKRKIMAQKLSIKNPDLSLQFPSQKPKTSYVMTKDKIKNSYTVWTKDDFFTLSGIATDRLQYISEIVIKDNQVFPKGKRLFLEHSSKDPVEFEEHFKLNQGKYRFDISARNLLYGVYDEPLAKQGETTINVNVYVDRSGPVIVITNFQPNVEIQGYLYDVSGVESLIADGKPVAISKENDNMFTIPLRFGMKSINLLTRDKLGNETKTIAGSTKLSLSPYLIRIAQANTGTVTDAGNIRLVQDAKPPIIKLLGWSDQHTVYLQRINIQGQILSQSRMDKLTINDVPVLPRVAGRNIIFNQSIDLEPGKNIIIIKAKNSTGISSRKMVINRKIPEAYQLKYRYGVALPPFVLSNKTITWNNLQPLLLNSFINQKRFQVVLRKNHDKISDSDKVGCHAILFGLLNETKNGLELIARIVDIETSTILAIEDAYSFSKNKEKIQWTVDRLVEKIHRKFPLTEGIIKTNNWWSFVPEFKNEDQYSPEIWPTVVFRNDKLMVNEITGESLGYDTTVIGYDCIKGKCKVLLDHQKPQKGDRVLTQ